jgi:hypothetical protein
MERLRNRVSTVLQLRKTINNGPLKIERVWSPKRLFEMVLHGTKPQKTSYILFIYLFSNAF